MWQGYKLYLKDVDVFSFVYTAIWMFKSSVYNQPEIQIVTHPKSLANKHQHIRTVPLTYIN